MKPMREQHYNLQFEKLCKALGLGELTATPEAISGGLLNRMYAVVTTSGKYAVKALNPQIMMRPTALANYLQAEQVVTLVADHLPAQPAIRVNGTFMQQIEGQYYLVFDWIDGQTLQAAECTETHCRQMGAILAQIHNTDFSVMGKSERGAQTPQRIDWRNYLEQGFAQAAVWANLMADTTQQLTLWNETVQEAAKSLAGEQIYSHRDLEPKNVMWRQGNPIVIDWESAGPIHPKVDLIETAIYWSGNEDGTVDKGRFDAFVAGYKGSNGCLEADWSSVLAFGYLSRLEWLEYSLKRSLGLESTDEGDQTAGTEQVTATIRSLIDYENMVSRLASWLND
jgi:Ser/Thr protein kinase RdoA (MazF antagonist)